MPTIAITAREEAIADSAIVEIRSFVSARLFTALGPAVKRVDATWFAAFANYLVDGSHLLSTDHITHRNIRAAEAVSSCRVGNWPDFRDNAERAVSRQGAKMTLAVCRDELLALVPADGSNPRKADLLDWSPGMAPDAFEQAKRDILEAASADTLGR